MIDILDELQEVNSYVKVHLRSGDILYGVPDIVEFDDDEETGEIIKSIHFFAMNKKTHIILERMKLKATPSAGKRIFPNRKGAGPRSAGLITL